MNYSRMCGSMLRDEDDDTETDIARATSHNRIEGVIYRMEVAYSSTRSNKERAAEGALTGVIG